MDEDAELQKAAEIVEQREAEARRAAAEREEATPEQVLQAEEDAKKMYTATMGVDAKWEEADQEFRRKIIAANLDLVQRKAAKRTDGNSPY